MQEQENMEQNIPEQNPSFDPNQPVHHSVWIPIVVIAGLVVGYLALAGANDWWPFGDQQMTTSDEEQEETVNADDNIEKFKGALENRDKVSSLSLMNENVFVVIEATDCCGNMSRDDAIEQIYSYIGESRIDFETNRDTINQLKSRNNLLSDAEIGTTSDNKFLVWFRVDDDNKVSQLSVGIASLFELFDDSTANWQTYRNEEFGFEVRYPGEYEAKFNKNSEIQGIDSGREASFTLSKSGKTSPFSFSMFSNDFGRGVGEGCCFEYADEPIDLNRSDEKIKKDVEEKFGEVMDFRRVDIGGRTGVRFFRLNSYGGSWIVDSIIFPFGKSPFANLLISSGAIVYFEDSVGDYAKQRDLAREFVDSREYVEKEEYTLFNQILSTFRFLE